MESLQNISIWTALFASLAAFFSAFCALSSFRFSRKLYDELKSDEKIIAGTPIHPHLSNQSHAYSVIQCTLFNKSKRKAYLNSISIYDGNNKLVDISWSNEIDGLGNPQNPCKLVGIIDSCQLYMRKSDGTNINYARIEISHSFSETPMTIFFESVRQ